MDYPCYLLSDITECFPGWPPIVTGINMLIGGDVVWIHSKGRIRSPKKGQGYGAHEFNFSHLFIHLR
jgi:hypothetical protein